MTSSAAAASLSSSAESGKPNRSGPLLETGVVPQGTDTAGVMDIFCNRELNMKQIRAIGFDMDYTLAQYYTAFDQLAFDGAKEKLVKDLGYPEEVGEFTYDPKLFSRGLVIDLERGAPDMSMPLCCCVLNLRLCWTWTWTCSPAFLRGGLVVDLGRGGPNVFTWWCRCAALC
ncbi:unnamed protein product [Discosporangium mesarthrocarpum]